MKVLALDTATEACSAALLIDGEVQHRYQLAPREHTRLILDMAQQLLQEAGCQITQLDCLAFGRGPGSFTGVRIATGVVQGMAFAADLPVVPVSTLASIAQLCCEEQGSTQVLAALDARMGGIYWGLYRADDSGLMRPEGNEQVSEPALLASQGEAPWAVAGSAVKAYESELRSNHAINIDTMYDQYLPHAMTMARLAEQAFQRGEAVEAAQAQPVYLRNDVAKKSAQQ